MYTKALIPGSDNRAPMPMIIILTKNYDAHVQPLKAAGWGHGEAAMQSEAKGHLHIAPEGGLEVIVDGAAILTDDANPASPPGWWAAVSARNDKCWAVMARPESINLKAPQTVITALYQLIQEKEVLVTTVSVVS